MKTQKKRDIKIQTNKKRNCIKMLTNSGKCHWEVSVYEHKELMTI